MPFADQDREKEWRADYLARTREHRAEMKRLYHEAHRAERSERKNERNFRWRHLENRLQHINSLLNDSMEHAFCGNQFSVENPLFIVDMPEGKYTETFHEPMPTW